MNKILFVMLITLLGLSCAYAGKNIQSLDHIVAIVNDEVITQSEFDHALTLTKKEMAGNSGHKIPTDKEILDNLINKKLQLQAAKQLHLTADDTEVDTAIKNIAQQNHITVRDFYQRLKEDGFTTELYRKELREQIIMQKLQHQELRLTVSQQEINRLLQSKAWKPPVAVAIPESYHIKDVLVSLKDTPTPEEQKSARKNAELILTELRQGKSLVAIKAAHPDFSTLQDNDLGWRKAAEVPSAFVPTLSHLQSKKWAGPIQAGNGFHLIYLAAVQTANQQKKVPDRRLAEDYLLQKKYTEAMQTWLAKLHSQAFIILHPES